MSADRAADWPPAANSKHTMPRPSRVSVAGLDICRKHTDVPVSMYCVTCETPCCPQCLTVDHPEPGHSGLDLDTAVQERLQNMKTLIQDCKEVKSQIDTDFAQGETVLSDLDSNYESVLEDLNKAEDNARRDFERRLLVCRENSLKRLQQVKDQRVQKIQGHMDSLKRDRDRLSNAIRVANQVTNSATKHEVALTYGTVAGKMQRLKDIKSAVISKAHAKLAFRQHDTCADMFKAEDMGNVIQRPGTSKVSFSQDTKPPSDGGGFDAASLARISGLDPSVLARHGVSLSSAARVPSGEDKVLKDAPNHINIMKKVDPEKSKHEKDMKKSEKPVEECDLKKPEKPIEAEQPDEETLELVREFGRDGDGKVKHARCVAVSPVTEDIVIVDYDTRQLKVYTSNGDFKLAVDTKQESKGEPDSKPWDVAVSSQGEYLVTDKTPFVKVYDPEGKSIGRFPAFSPDKHRSDIDDVGLYCINTDVNGRILVGAGNFYISIHSAARDGCHLSSISVRLPPGFMATTSEGHIVIGSWSQQKVMIIDQSGEVLHNLLPPQGTTSWRPRGVCCSYDDELYIANQVTGKTPGKSGVHRYQVLSGEHMGCVTNEVKAPLGIAILPDKSVVTAEKSVVKIFQWPVDESSSSSSDEEGCIEDKDGGGNQ